MIKKILFATFLLINTAFLSAAKFTEDPWNGEEYHRNSSSQKEAAADLLNKIHLNGSESILDIGCGDGKITASLSKLLNSGRILGIDLSASMIDFAKKVYSNTLYPNLEFELMPAEEIDFHEAFDVLLSFTTMQWIRDHSLVLAKVWDSLNSSGIFGVTMPMGFPSALEKAVNEVIHKEKWKNYFINFDNGYTFVTLEEYTEYLKKQGFDIVCLEVVRQEDIFTSVAFFKGFISQWFPYLRPLPNDEKEVFMTEVLDRYIEGEPLDESGQLHFRILRLESIAQKK